MTARRALRRQAEFYGLWLLMLLVIVCFWLGAATAAVWLWGAA